jgi:hypothetical protein
MPAPYSLHDRHGAGPTAAPLNLEEALEDKHEHVRDVLENFGRSCLRTVTGTLDRSSWYQLLDPGAPG